MLTISLLIITAYLIGSLSSAIIICRVKGLPDPRTHGSANAGATNVLRLADKKTAAFVLFSDFFKGFVVVMIGRAFDVDTAVLGWLVLAAMLGHIFPIFFKFKGGKGVATAVGGLLALSWPVAIICLLIWLLTVKLSHVSSIGALVSTACAPIVAYFFLPSFTAITPLLFVATLLFWTHRSNMQRLRRGEEPMTKW